MLVLAFDLGDERCGIAARQVIEVVPRVTLRPLPRAPAYIAGLFTFRGRATPVVDLGMLVAERPCPASLSTRIIIVAYPLPNGDGSRPLGLLVANLTDTVAIDPAELQPAGVQVDEAPYLGRVATTADGMLQCLEVPALLRPEVRQTLFTDLAEAEPEHADDQG